MNTSNATASTQRPAIDPLTPTSISVTLVNNALQVTPSSFIPHCEDSDAIVINLAGVDILVTPHNGHTTGTSTRISAREPSTLVPIKDSTGGFYATLHIVESSSEKGPKLKDPIVTIDSPCESRPRHPV